MTERIGQSAEEAMADSAPEGAAPDLRAEIAHAVEAIASIIEPWRDGKVLRQRIHAELTKLAAVRAGGVSPTAGGE
jgi:hypothetical protein